MRRRRTWVLVAAVMMAVPACLLAQTSPATAGTATVATLTFPDDDPNDPVDDPNVNVETGASGTQDVHLKIKGSCPNVKANNIMLSGPMKGKKVALDTVNALCSKAVNLGYTCSGIIDDGGCNTADPNNPDCCSATDPNATQQFSCTISCLQQRGGFALGGFTLDRRAGSEHIEATPPFGGTLVGGGLTCRTNAGNPFEEDLLPLFNIGIVRQGTDGVFKATFAFDLDPNTPPDGVVTVDSADPNVVDPSASLTDQDLQLHQALADGIIGLGFDLDVRVLPGVLCPTISSSPELYGSTLLHIPNISETGVVAVGLSGPEGASVIGETTTIGGEPIPTLSEWGLILLVAVLFLTGFWMLRRRRPGEAT